MSNAMVTAVAVTLVLLVVLVPGMALLRTLPTACPLGVSVAIAAPAGLGFMYLIGLAADGVGLPLLPTCLVVAAAMGVVWLAAEFRPVRRSSLRSSFSSWRSGFDHPAVWGGRALLIAAIALGVWLWCGFHSQLVVPAGWDAMHHGYFVRQIVDHHTLRPAVVQSSEPNQADAVANFYPQAPHLVAALVHVASDIRISTVLFALTTSFGGVILPLGVYGLVRWASPQQHAVAGFAALASVLPAGLYSIDYYGKITTIIGIALVPAGVATLLMINRHTLFRLGPIAVLALFGVVEAHTSEVPICVAVAGLVMIADAHRAREWRALASRLGCLVGVGAATIAALLLADPGTRDMLSQRSAYFTIYHPSPLSASVKYFTLGPLKTPITGPFPVSGRVWLVLAIAGCVATLHPRWRRLAPLGAAYAGFLAFSVAWTSGFLGPFSILGDPWYQMPIRMFWELFGLGAIPVGVSLTAVTTGIGYLAGHRSRIARQTVGRRVTVAFFVSAALATAVWLTLPPVVSMSSWARRNESPVSTDSLAAFRYLHRHLPPGARVLDDLDLHGDMWMYIDYRVPTIFGNPPFIGSAPDSWKQRLYLRGELKSVRTNGCVSDLLRTYDVRYVYYSDDAMFDNLPRFGPATLDNPRYFREVFSRGTAHVYRVRPVRSSRSCRFDTAAVFRWDTVADAR